MEGRSSHDNVCVVCFRNINIYAVGSCDHYDRVCFICSARLRVLCQKNECPICRKNLPKVIFTRQKQPFSVLSRQPYSCIDHKHNISFEDEDVEEEYRVLQQHQCKLCPQINVYQSFGHLKDHMRKIHEKFYCELCVEHLKQFTFERKYYNRRDLAQHRRTGDSDDTSHRGHPRCQFCDTRYLDKDELFRHLRRDHFYCHFCDSEGSYQFYGDYELLRSHFRDEHFLCQEGSCIDEKFTSAFRSEMELKMHRAAQHSRNYPKQQQKQARTLELEFTITPRSQYDDFDEGNRRGGHRKGPRGGGGGGGGSGMGGPRGRYRYEEEPTPEIPDEIERQVSYDIDANSAVEFPTLGNDSNANQTSAPIRRPPPRNYREFNAMDEESFPSLGGGATSSGNASLRLQIYNNQDKNYAKPTANLSIKVSSNLATKPKTQSQSQNGPNAASVLASTKPKPKPQQSEIASSGWYGNSFDATSQDFPTLVSQPTKKSTLSWIPNTGATKQTNKNNVWLKNSSTNEVVKKPPPKDEEFTLVVNSKDKKKKQQQQKGANNNSNNNIKAKSPEKEVVTTTTTALPTKTNPKKEPSPVNDRSSQKPVKPSNDTTLTKIKPTSIPIDDFPPLSFEPPKPLAPPGFGGNAATPTTAALKKKPLNEPPPGFNPGPATTNGGVLTSNGALKTSSANFTLSSLARQLSVSVSTRPISPPVTNGEYVEPENFQSRNRQLIDLVMRLLEQDDDKFSEFKKYSGEFRKGLIPAKEYYDKCVKIFGADKFIEVLSELLVLLPDIPKQRELLKVYNEVNQKNKPRNVSFLICATCEQVLSNLDFRTHTICHDNVTFSTS